MRSFSLSAGEVRIYPEAGALARAAADEFIRCACEAISARKRFAVALNGGTTPKGVYSALAADYQVDRNKVPWDGIHIFFGDERSVPPTDADSNFRLARETLLTKVPVRLGNIHRVRAELGARAAAADYERWLQSFFHPPQGKFPQFDLIMLGLGADGHTASLFPETEALKEQARWVCPNWVPSLKTHRITFTYPVLNNAVQVMFMVAGQSKAEILRRVLHARPADPVCPAQFVRPTSGKMLWLVDEAAASLLG